MRIAGLNVRYRLSGSFCPYMFLSPQCASFSARSSSPGVPGTKSYPSLLFASLSLSFPKFSYS